LCLAIEPMFTLGTHEVRVKNDGWTVVTADGSLAAHFENTIALTADGPRILTEPTADLSVLVGSVSTATAGATTPATALAQVLP
jgi:hypothetical protein